MRLRTLFLTLACLLPTLFTSPLRSDAAETFVMAVNDVFPISGRGMVAIGTVERGVVKVNDTLELIGGPTARTVTVSSIDLRGRALPEAKAGQEVGLVLRGVTSAEIRRGQVLATAGVLKAVAVASARVELLAADAGGRKGPITSSYRPLLRFRSLDTSATFQLPSGQTELAPGASANPVELRFSEAVPLEKGQSFEILEGGKTIGKGVIL